MLATVLRRCNEDAMRKLLPWNFSLTACRDCCGKKHWYLTTQFNFLCARSPFVLHTCFPRSKRRRLIANLELELWNFFTKGNNIKSCQMDDKSPIKGAWFCSRDPFLVCNCGLRIISPRHSASCYQQKRARRTLMIAPTALEATHAKA